MGVQVSFLGGAGTPVGDLCHPPAKPAYSLLTSLCPL